MSRFSFVKTSINNLKIIIPKQIKDERGYFERYFCYDEFKQIGLNKHIFQINHSFTKQKGSIRGMHFQTYPHSETKIVRCLKGSIYDVAIDLRVDSPTFLQHFGIVLSEKNNKYLYIPEGFAHGFQTLEHNAEILYLVTMPFEQTADTSINPLDPMINIKWKLNITNISFKDKNAPFITNDFIGYGGGYKLKLIFYIYFASYSTKTKTTYIESFNKFLKTLFLLTHILLINSTFKFNSRKTQ